MAAFTWWRRVSTESRTEISDRPDNVVVYARASDKPEPADSAPPSDDLDVLQGLDPVTACGSEARHTEISEERQRHVCYLSAPTYLEKNAGTKLALNTGDKVYRKEAIAQAGPSTATPPHPTSKSWPTEPT